MSADNSPWVFVYTFGFGDGFSHGQFGSFPLKLWSSLTPRNLLENQHPCPPLCVRVSGCYTVHTPTFSPVLQGGQGSASRSGAPTRAWPSPVCSWCASSGGPSRLGPSLQVRLYQGNLHLAWAATAQRLPRSGSFCGVLVGACSTGINWQPVISACAGLELTLLCPPVFCEQGKGGSWDGMTKSPAQLS